MADGRVLLIAAALTALPLAAGPASACSRIATPDFLVLQWLPDGRLFGNLGDQAGFYHLHNRTFEPVAFGDAWSGALAASPDGAWVAVASGDEQPGPPGFTCNAGWGSTEAIHPRSGEHRKLIDWAAYRFAAGPLELAVLHRYLDWVTFFEWGRWDRPRVLDGAASSTRASPDAVGAMAYSEDGALLAMAPNTLPEVVVLDAVSARTVHRIPLPDSAPVRALVFSPDAARLAAFTGGPDGGTLRVARLGSQASWTAEQSHTAGLLSLDWGPAGLAAAFGPRPGTGPGPWNLRLYSSLARTLADPTERVFEEPLGALAWSPDGQRLAVGGEGLRILDTQLRTVAAYEVEQPQRQPPFPPLRGTFAPRVDAVSAADGGPAARNIPVPLWVDVVAIAFALHVVPRHR